MVTLSLSEGAARTIRRIMGVGPGTHLFMVVNDSGGPFQIALLASGKTERVDARPPPGAPAKTE